MVGIRFCWTIVVYVEDSVTITIITNITDTVTVIIRLIRVWNEGTVKWLGEKEASQVYNFGKWKVLEVVTNKRGDIHARLEKI